MIVRFNPGVMLAVLALAVGARGAMAATDTVLVVSGDVEKPYALTAAAFAALPHQRVHAEGHDAKESDFDGVLLSELLRRAGVKLGSEMRGERVAIAVVVVSVVTLFDGDRITHSEGRV